MLLKGDSVRKVILKSMASCRCQGRVMRNERQRRLVSLILRRTVENDSGRCRSSLGMMTTRQEDQGNRAIQGGADRDMGSIQSAHVWRGIKGITLACT